uniref:MYND-type domain-containing protein n=1 Tax=Periophthalmus magnuspinnatus TaxID=409849 RepID=A0A3B4BJP2_9GOBI
MTRTHPPDILASTLYRDITLNPITHHPILHASPQCDLKMIDKPEIINKRHCRSFDFIESLDDPQALSSSVEYPYKRSEARSKSTPRIKATLTPVPISVSPPSTRKGRDAPQAAQDAQKESYSSNRAFLNEVHPIKLQPHTPLYVSDCFEEDKPDKPATTPHVRCRVDIKPDAAVLQQTRHNVRSDNQWQRYSQAGSSRGLYVQPPPRQIGSSPTPTPSECYSGDFRQGYHYTTSMSPISYQAYSNPNIPTKFFYTEDPVRYPIHHFSRPYFQDDRVYSRPYSTSEAGSYMSHTPVSRPYFGDDSRYNTYHPTSSGLFYSKPYVTPTETYIPTTRLYHTEGRRRPSEGFSNDWYRSSISGYSSQSFQHTHSRLKETGIPTWYGSVDTTRLGEEAKNHSKSFDNILYPHLDRGQSVPRGRSYENLFHQPRHGASSDVTSQPVILNLSSSPRRYAALSLSENSLDKGSSNPWRNTKGGQWFVTPEITITDNDLCAGNNKRREGHSVSWDVMDSENRSTPRVMPQKQESLTTDLTKDRKHNNDKLLADLVVDYKPPTSRKSSDDLLDQLKQLINVDDKDQCTSGVENLQSSDTQVTSSKSSPDTNKEGDSGCDALQRSAEECSPDHSTDEDDNLVCANKKCNRAESMFNACLYFKSCHSCYTFYCSRTCRRDDWETHKETCLYGRVSSVCRHTLKFCRENTDIHKAFSRVAKAGYLSRGRGVLFLGFANPDTANNFLQVGLESLLMSPTYLSLRELDGFKDNLGEYCKELQQAGNEYDPNECFLLNVSIAVGELVPNRPSPRIQAPTVRKYAKVSLASSSPDKKVLKQENEMETLILTPPPGTPDIDREGEEGRKAREVCFVNIQRELRTRGVFLRHEYPKIYNHLCEFVENNIRFTPTTIYPIDKRTGKQFMCMIMAASEPRTLEWVGTPHLLDDII